MPTPKNCLALLAGLALAAAPALAQTTPRGVEKQARTDRKMERAHTIRHGESLSKQPKLLRKEGRLAHRAARKTKE